MSAWPPWLASWPRRRTSKFERLIQWEPGFDCMRFECRHGSERCMPGGGGSHGCNGLQLRFVLKGEAGAVQFLLMTDWLPEPKSLDRRKRERIAALYPLPADLGYHSLRPHYKDQFESEKCEFLGGRRCYYDGSGLNADEPFRVLCNEGEEALWEYLAAYYQHTFEGADWPEPKPYKWKPRPEPAAAVVNAVQY